jgi:hypothetical protein
VGSLLGVASGYQLALAAGAPLGHAAWGGNARRLPIRLRWASLTAAPVLAVAAWIILARAGVLEPGPEPTWVRASTWLFAGVFALNTAWNLASRSPLERLVMAPLTIILTICFLLVASK